MLAPTLTEPGEIAGSSDLQHAAECGDKDAKA